MQNIIKDENEKEISSEEYLSRIKEGLTNIEIVDKILATLANSTPQLKEKLFVFMDLYGVLAR
jgi:hypothetical protein